MRTIRQMCMALEGRVYVDTALDVRCTVAAASERPGGYIRLTLADTKTGQPVGARVTLGAWTVTELLRGGRMSDVPESEFWLEEEGGGDGDGEQ